MSLKGVVLALLIAFLAAVPVSAEDLSQTPVPQTETDELPGPTQSQPASGAPAMRTETEDFTAAAPAPAAESPVLYSTPDFNRDIFYKNKLELSTEVGVLPINTPMLAGPIFGYSFHRPRKRSAAFYTLVPAILTLRWQLYTPDGPSFLRGNTEFTFGGTFTGMPEGRESMFAGPMIGVRYNFVQPGWRLVPYADLRFGLGYTDANQPWQVAHHLRADGQGQDFTFSFVMGAGVRYNFSPRYSASLGVAAYHISNLYMSEPKYSNHGINVVGPMLGFNLGLNGLFRRAKE